MRWKTGVLILLGVISVSVDARVVGQGVATGGERTTCKLINRTADGKLQNTCSATLTAQNQVTTAAHCVDRVARLGLTTSIECGFTHADETGTIEKTARGSSARTGGLYFDEKRMAKEIQIAKSWSKDAPNITDVNSDFAQISFEPAITDIPPIALLSREEMAKEFFVPEAEYVSTGLRPGVECKIEGYGYNNEMVGGVLRSAPLQAPLRYLGSEKKIYATQKFKPHELTPEVRSRAEACVDAHRARPGAAEMGNFLTVMQHLMTPIIAPGDSGGPIYCRKDGQSPWRYVGIASSGQINGGAEISHEAAWGLGGVRELQPLREWSGLQ